MAILLIATSFFCNIFILMTIFKGILLLFIMSAISVSAQTKQAPVIKSGNPYIKIVEAYTQQMLPGAKGAIKKTDQHFVVIWKGVTFPKVFCWRTVSDFTPCSAEKAHKIPAKTKHNFPAGMEYNTEKVSSDAIHKGDTLMLTPIIGARYTVPAEIPKTAKNTLFFKTGNSNWLAIPIKKIGKKAPIALP